MITSPSDAELMAVWMLSPAPTLWVAPWALIPPRPKVRRKTRLNFFMIRKRYFTVAPVDSMVTVPPAGTKAGVVLNWIGMGLSVVLPLGM